MFLPKFTLIDCCALAVAAIATIAHAQTTVDENVSVILLINAVGTFFTLVICVKIRPVLTQPKINCANLKTVIAKKNSIENFC